MASSFYARERQKRLERGIKPDLRSADVLIGALISRFESGNISTEIVLRDHHDLSGMFVAILRTHDDDFWIESGIGTTAAEALKNLADNLES